MRINHNIMALNAWRNLVFNSAGLAKSLERLSSGLRINRAADDAAGLAISEKMRAQITGLRVAQRNAQDAISLVQTAEGALAEVHSTLQRMRELALQAASDTSTLSDRWQIQQEMNQLAEELTRIGNTTEFNTRKLLDGTFNGSFQIGANASQTISVSIGDVRASSLGVVQGQRDVQFDVGTTKLNPNSTDNDVSALVAGAYIIEVDATTNKVILKAEDGTKLGEGTVQDFDGTGTPAPVSIMINPATNPSAKPYLKNPNASATVKLAIYDEDPAVTTVKVTGGTAKIYIVDQDQGLSLLTKDNANLAVQRLDAAIERVSSQRARLGAVQNRLEHTIQNLATAEENLTAAESRIRDADMAFEMAQFVRAQILQQASTAMLAQANVVPQTVLQLLGR